MGKMLAKISTRRYGAGLEPVGTAVEAHRKATSRSAVSRRFVAATETALAEPMAQDLSSLDLVALMIGGVDLADHFRVVAVGIDADGVQHPLGVVEDDTESSTRVTDLLVGLRERGLCVTKPILCVLDGAKALRSAAKAFLTWSSRAASSTRSATRRATCLRRSPAWWRSPCAPPIAAPTPWPARVTSRRWHESSSGPPRSGGLTA